MARKVVTDGPASTAEITPTNVNDYLGILKYRESWLEKHNEIGLTTGLAWTEVGGSVLVTEATLMEGKGRLNLTGKLGDVMQESAQAAMAYIRSRSHAFGLPKDFYRNIDIHVHVPEGAIPKDGPSAGITICTTIVSALTRIPVRCDLAMTGEITLRGKVLPIGGVKEKLLAAHRMGLRTVILPKDNEKDLADIPQEILSSLTVHFVEIMDEVLQIALERPIVPLELAAVAPVAEPFVGGTEKDKSLTN
jgi:ATP-dependent Lon protease